MAKEAIGIYISSRSVDIVQLDGSLFSPRLKNFIREEIPPLPAGAPKEDKEELLQNQVSHRERVSSAIKEGLKKMNVKSANVHTILPTSDVMIRYFSMPNIPKSEQAQAVRFEVRKYVPFKIEKLASDFKILPPASQSKRMMDVFFIAATKDNLNFHLDLFKKADADAVGVDIIPFALVKTLILSKKASAKDSVAVLYIDNDRTSVSIHIIERGIPFLSRDVKISAGDKDAFFEKAVSEIRVSLDYYRRQKPQTDITKVIVCGEKLYDGLDTFIADELKIVTETLDRFTGVRGAEKVSPSFILALGAAVGGLGRSHHSINLSPFAGIKEKRKLANIIYMEAIAALFIILATFIVTSFQIGRLSIRLNRTQKQETDLLPETTMLDNKALNILNNRTLEELRFLQLILNDRISWTEMMEALTRAIPEGIWITGFDAREHLMQGGGASKYPASARRSLIITGNAFSLEGSSREIDNIGSFLTALKNDEGFARFFDEIELGPIQERSEREHMISSFEINAAREKFFEEGRRAWQSKR